MSKNTSVTIGPRLETFIQDQIDEGEFKSVSEAVRAGLKLLEKRQFRLKSLREEVAQGIASGIADEDLSIEDLIKKSK